MKRIISLILITVILSAVTLTACGSHDSAVGFWIIQKVTAEDVVMSEEDAKSFGLTAVGSLKLQKSDICQLNLLGEEYSGTWKRAGDGTITVKIDEEMTLTGSVDDDGVMQLTDPQGTEYILSK